ncbi:MAG TPA: transporter substrate-binding domain-containing protein [Alphaproteobacteria bacterium]|nr:transporter substrate-binding domain-containing protein [Alphaproteobacteria bacterium]
MRRGLAALAALLLLSSAPPPTLLVGVDGRFPPFSSTDSQGRLSGFDIEIAQALCIRLEERCGFVHEPFDGLIDGLRKGRFAVAVSSIEPTAARRAAVAFTRPYHRSPALFLAARPLPARPPLAGRRVGVLDGTPMAEWLARHAEGAEIRRYPQDDQAALPRDLKAGRLDLVFEEATSWQALKDLPDWQGLSPAGEPVPAASGATSAYAIAVRAEDAALLSRVDSALAALKADGTYARINARYFPFSIDPER